ncbi:hypothetical protein [Leeuwenhoekiella nanhaiensis]|uniref:Uncharacterized protein n=1 Tax=Leeuwenhoekiella nanhaiensis TaxID=1655491 RepID=A0A2G1VN08_9FLAO|nr:hypothetical protein [Leeuwenhoekiella nanhaiensis]PHQ27869.1 hypothetical protein CJ305_17850 [Leeuwenhoekiella nanhaiensis]
MTLAFSQKLNDKPTYFVEKIWEGFLRSDQFQDCDETYHRYMRAHKVLFGKHWDWIPEKEPRMKSGKLHTIRRDEKDRWKAGNKIHFVINNRTADRFQFAPVAECKAIQYIEISYDELLCEKFSSEPAVFVDGEPLNISQIEELAINDGFKNTMEFFQYFDNDFSGKIIHWTDLIY